MRNIDFISYQRYNNNHNVMTCALTIMSVDKKQAELEGEHILYAPPYDVKKKMDYIVILDNRKLKPTYEN